MKRIYLAVACAVAIFAFGFSAYFLLGSERHGHLHPVQAAEAEEGGPLSSATVSFGGWMTSPALDRFPNANPIPAVHHRLSPETVKIKQGGTVNFIIGGFHHVLVYDDGTQPTDIDSTMTIPPTNGGPPLIDDPDGRIYRGLDPSMFPQDRVEVVQFDEPGIYLVVCGVLPHFQDNMYGFVRVLPTKKADE